METMLISRETLARRWEISVPTIIKYENEGVIKRVAGVPTPRYNLNEIMKLEGSDLSPLSPLERKRMKETIEKLENENQKLKQILAAIQAESMKLNILGGV